MYPATKMKMVSEEKGCIHAPWSALNRVDEVATLTTEEAESLENPNRDRPRRAQMKMMSLQGTTEMAKRLYGAGGGEAGTETQANQNGRSAAPRCCSEQATPHITCTPLVIADAAVKRENNYEGTAENTRQ